MEDYGAWMSAFMASAVSFASTWMIGCIIFKFPSSPYFPNLSLWWLSVIASFLGILRLCATGAFQGTHEKGWCDGFAVLYHYLCMCVLAWLIVIGLELCLKHYVLPKESMFVTKKRFIFASHLAEHVFAWILPALLCLLVHGDFPLQGIAPFAAENYYGRMKDDTCLIRDDIARFVVVFCPSFVLGCVMVLLVALMMWRNRINAEVDATYQLFLLECVGWMVISSVFVCFLFVQCVRPLLENVVLRVFAGLLCAFAFSSFAVLLFFIFGVGQYAILRKQSADPAKDIQCTDSAELETIDSNDVGEMAIGSVDALVCTEIEETVAGSE